MLAEIIVNTGGSYFQPLSWTLRLKIALGAARGLAFLHSTEDKIIYRDFKTSNILLDTVCKLVLALFLVENVLYSIVSLRCFIDFCCAEL